MHLIHLITWKWRRINIQYFYLYMITFFKILKIHTFLFSIFGLQNTQLIIYWLVYVL